MAANYWDSTQRKYWTFTKQQLAQERRKNEEVDRALVQQFPLPDRRLLSIHFNHRKNLHLYCISISISILSTSTSSLMSTLTNYLSS
jgi:cyclin C